jgi:hypothetical protein
MDAGVRERHGPVEVEEHRRTCEVEHAADGT